MPTENQPIRVLLVEDSREQTDLLQRLLGFSEFPKFTLTVAASLAAGLARLEEGAEDLVLLDLVLPDSKGVATFRKVNAAAPDVPIVILSGIADVTGAIEMVQEGAQDYLVKGHVDTHLLLRSIQYAIERKRSQVAARQVNAELETRVAERTAALIEANEQLRREVNDRRHAEEQLIKSNRQLTVALAELRAAQRSKAAPECPAPSVREIEDIFKRIQQHSELMLHAPALMSNPARAAEQIQVIVSAVEAGKKAIRKTRENAEPSPAPVETPKRAGTVETVSLDAVFEKALALIKPKAGDEGRAAGGKVTFVKKIKKGVEVLGDPVRLREMLVHMLRNAMNAIPKRGTVTVGTEQLGMEVIAFVQDDGLGLTEAVRRRLLDPCANVDHLDERLTGYEVIHEVVARHRGRLDIESRKGIGTKVRVILPSAKSAGAIARRHRVLAVDDDPMVREVIGTYLSEDIYSVELAANGKEALEKFCAGEFDLVLTDLAMPGMQGDELAREMKKRKPKVPVLLLTGFGERLTAKGGKPDGVDLVMSKPFTMAGLQDTLAKFLQRSA